MSYVSSGAHVVVLTDVFDPHSKTDASLVKNGQLLMTSNMLMGFDLFEVKGLVGSNLCFLPCRMFAQVIQCLCGFFMAIML